MFRDLQGTKHMQQMSSKLLFTIISCSLIPLEAPFPLKSPVMMVTRNTTIHSEKLK